MGFFDKIKEGLRKTRENISGSIETMLHSFTKIDEELFEELEELLVMGDVGIHTAERICEELRVRVKKDGVTDPNDVMGLIKEIVADMLSGGEELQIQNKPAAILVIGVNGVGKTTTIGKIASRLKKEGNSVVLGAADTFRAAAIDQLEVWSERAGVPLVKRDEGSDPASVVFDTIARAKSMHADVLICDTAGRLHNKKNLMDELGKMSRILDRELPDSDKEVLLVLDATTGQNAVNQAREFKNAAGITGIILTKLDGTAKGGVVLAIREELQLPVKFIGVGEQLDDLQPFNAEEFAEALFDNEKTVDEDTIAKIAEQNARYDAYGELIEDGEDEWAKWETGTEAGDAAQEAEEFVEDLREALQEAMGETEAEEAVPEEMPEPVPAPVPVIQKEVKPVPEAPVQKEAAAKQPEPVVTETAEREKPAEETQHKETREERRARKELEKAERWVRRHGGGEDSPVETTVPEVQPEPERTAPPVTAGEEEPHKETWEERRARKEREKAEKRARRQAEMEQKAEEKPFFEEPEEIKPSKKEKHRAPVYEDEGLTAEEEAALEEYENAMKETKEERRARKEREKAEKRARKEERRNGR